MKNTNIRNKIAWMAVGLMAAATTQAALVGHWTFDETSGTNAVDASGNGYDGTVVNPAWTSGVIGGALRFDGTCNVSDFGAVLTNTTTELSISLWCFGDASQPVNGNLFSAYATGTNAYRRLNCHFPFSNGNIFFDAQSYPSFNQRDRINKAYEEESDVWGAWNHWVFTKNATSGTMSMYLNGALWHSDTGMTNLMDNTADFMIGSDRDIFLYQGLMDDFRVYDNELSSTDVLDLYSAVTPDYAVADLGATPVSGVAPLDVNFDGSLSSSAGAITSYDWDFGDGNVGSGINATHTYTTGGIYTATLTVTDNSGNTNIDRVNIEVFNPLPIRAGDTLAIDFGATPSGTDNYNDVIYPNLDPMVLKRLSDGIVTGVILDVEMDGGAQRNQSGYVAGNGGITNDASIYADGIALWNSGANNNSITLTFTGLDDELVYDIVGGSSRDDAFIESFSTDWEINGIELHSDCTVSNGYVNFTDMASTGGTLVVTITDANYRVGVAQVALTAVSTIPDVPVIAFANDGNSLTWNSNGDFLYSVQSNLNLSMGGGWGTFTNVIGTIPETTVDLPAKGENVEFYRVIFE